MPHIPRLKEYRMRAKVSQARLARLANVDSQTVSRAENGFNIQDVNCAKIIEALNETDAFRRVPLTDAAIDPGGKNGAMPKKGNPATP